MIRPGIRLLIKSCHHDVVSLRALVRVAPAEGYETVRDHSESVTCSGFRGARRLSAADVQKKIVDSHCKLRNRIAEDVCAWATLSRKSTIKIGLPFTVAGLSGRNEWGIIAKGKASLLGRAAKPVHRKSQARIHQLEGKTVHLNPTFPDPT